MGAFIIRIGNRMGISGKVLYVWALTHESNSQVEKKPAP
jgi:hypothetical protein